MLAIVFGNAKYAPNLFSSRGRTWLRTPFESLKRSETRPLVGWGGGYRFPIPQRTRCLSVSTFGRRSNGYESEFKVMRGFSLQNAATQSVFELPGGWGLGKQLGVEPPTVFPTP